MAVPIDACALRTAAGWFLSIRRRFQTPDAGLAACFLQDFSQRKTRKQESPIFGMRESKLEETAVYPVASE